MHTQPARTLHQASQDLRDLVPDLRARYGPLRRASGLRLPPWFDPERDLRANLLVRCGDRFETNQSCGALFDELIRDAPGVESPLPPASPAEAWAPDLHHPAPARTLAVLDWIIDKLTAPPPAPLQGRPITLRQRLDFLNALHACRGILSKTRILPGNRFDFGGGASWFDPGAGLVQNMRNYLLWPGGCANPASATALDSWFEFALNQWPEYDDRVREHLLQPSPLRRWVLLYEEGATQLRLTDWMMTQLRERPWTV